MRPRAARRGGYDASRIHEDSASMTAFRPNDTAAIPVAWQ